MAKCENCGAEIGEHEPRCSHCGTFQYPGAEKEYWDKVRKVHEDLKDLEEVPREAYEREIKRHARTLGRRMGIGAAILAVVIGGWMIWSYHTETREQEEQKAQLVWQKEHFPQLDEWYAEGDYDAILEFEQELYEEDSPYHIWNWEHASFLAGYEEYCLGKEAGRILKSQPDQKDRDYWLEELIFQTMSLRWRLDSRDLQSYTEEEKRLLRGYQEETWELTREILALEDAKLTDAESANTESTEAESANTESTETESANTGSADAESANTGLADSESADARMEDLWSEVSRDGVVSYKACQAYVKKWKEGGDGT